MEPSTLVVDCCLRGAGRLALAGPEWAGAIAGALVANGHYAGADRGLRGDRSGPLYRGYRRVVLRACGGVEVAGNPFRSRFLRVVFYPGVPGGSELPVSARHPVGPADFCGHCLPVDWSSDSQRSGSARVAQSGLEAVGFVVVENLARGDPVVRVFPTYGAVMERPPGFRRSTQWYIRHHAPRRYLQSGPEQ